MKTYTETLTKRQREHVDADGNPLHYAAPGESAACKTCVSLVADGVAALGAVLKEANNAAIDMRAQAYPAVVEAKAKFTAVCDKHGLYVLRYALEDAERTIARIAVYGPAQFYGTGQDVACDLAKSVGFIAGNLNLKALIDAGARFDTVLEAAEEDATRLTPADDGAVRQRAHGYREGRWY